MSVEFESYERLLKNRPFKFSGDEVNFRAGENDARCDQCIHFFKRKLDGFTVCEIFRPEEESEEAVAPNYVCDFFTTDGEEYPFQEE